MKPIRTTLNSVYKSADILKFNRKFAPQEFLFLETLYYNTAILWGATEDGIKKRVLALHYLLYQKWMWISFISFKSHLCSHECSMFYGQANDVSDARYTFISCRFWLLTPKDEGKVIVESCKCWNKSTN